ncbi:DNA/RNA non-specific endonuclease [Paraburkholderia sp. SIMBA_053]|uniref:DNA/RNA non-specific endonuclease n=1 Tax=Paraburkholderia sp. SIMBA_053 TaxID=3085794 RepID=UPI00397D6A9F
MSATPQDNLERLRRFNASVHASDRKLAEESADLARAEVLELAPSPGTTTEAIEFESIVLRRTRPVLAIRDNATILKFADAADSAIWQERLTRAESLLDRPIRAVGRIDLKGGRLDWVGTGWLVAENVLVTNRHVAHEFATRRGEGFTFRVGQNGRISADVDFLQEIDSPKTLVFELVRPLHIEEPPGPDVSFFEVEMTGGNAKLAMPIELAAHVDETKNIATIGYPAYDSRIPEPDLMERIFGKVYNKKRLAPGAITRVEQTRLLHNCTTLGGNSGSVVVDLDSGQALGLHFSGSFLDTNYAVRADVVKKLLDDVRSGRHRNVPAPGRPRPAPPVSRPAVERPPQAPVGQTSFTIPLTVTVSLGAPQNSVAPADARTPMVRFASPDADDGDDAIETEAAVSDYFDRKGYQTAFLGSDFAVPLPVVERDASDVLVFDLEGRLETELRYEHFSVVMSRSRRMCFWSAVNIDGNQSRKSPRVTWKWDPRIPKAQQIMQECYGNPPKFSRGHMTRREDPGWGNPAVARRGNEDSMHVTNATPQMQAFNAPIWLALEDYALQHAREDDMKISVFTGPYFDDEDPTRYSVRIPIGFWKVIAFIHDDTGQLCATGYEMSQEHSLPPEDEFVFGAFTSPQLGIATQVPIRAIERRSGIGFGPLAGIDPLVAADESFAAEEARPAPLEALSQIRFLL